MSCSAPAAVPPAINYQGRLTDAAGVPQSGIKSMSVKIFDGSTAGILLYSEPVGNVAIDANGVYGFQFGTSGILGALASGSEQWLELSVNGVAQTPRQRLLAVPFAMIAGGLPDGAVTAPMIANGAIGASKLAPGAASANLSLPGPFAGRAEAIAGGVGDGSLYFKPDGSIWRVALFQPLTKFCAVGDSITDRSTYYTQSGYDAICYCNSGWAAILEQLANRKVVSVGPTVMNPSKVGVYYNRDHGYSGITAYFYMNGSPFLPSGFHPIDDAIASNPDVYIVHIGTNDLDQTAATLAQRVRAVWAALTATGKPVIGTDILQRAASHNDPISRDKIIAVNAILRSSWRTAGLTSYRQWDDLIDKDSGTGYAAKSEFPEPADGIHPSMRVSLKLARDLHSLLRPYYAGISPVAPAYGDTRWATLFSNVTGGVTLATGWAPSFLGNVGTDVIFSKIQDSQGDWQRVQIVNGNAWSATKGMYTAKSAGTTFSPGDRCVATARIRVPSGTNLNGIGLSVQCVGAAVPWLYPVFSTGAEFPSPIGEYDVTIYSDPFTIPAGTTQLQFLINPSSGSGTFDFQNAGVFKCL